jgi:hypothetical protein
MSKQTAVLLASRWCCGVLYACQKVVWSICGQLLPPPVAQMHKLWMKVRVPDGRHD